MASLRAIRVSFWCVSRKTGFQSARASSTEGSSPDVSSRALAGHFTVIAPIANRLLRSKSRRFMRPICYERVYLFILIHVFLAKATCSLTFPTQSVSIKKRPTDALVAKHFKGWIR
jgi:hypothetical protein